MPIWMLIAQGVKKIADNQNEQANTTNNSTQPTNNTTRNNNTFSTLSSIYSNYLNGDTEDKKKKNWFSQLFGR